MISANKQYVSFNDHAEAAEKLRFSAQGIRPLQSKLKLSQADFTKLVGVSSLTIYQRERQEGKLTLRQVTRNKLAAIRGLGIREALQWLGKAPNTEPQKYVKRDKRQARKQ